MCKIPKLDLVNMNAYIKFGENLSICSQDMGGNEILALIKGHNSGTNMRKRTCNNPKLDPVNINAYIKFGENLSICSQDIELKQNYDGRMDRWTDGRRDALTVGYLLGTYSVRKSSQEKVSTQQIAVIFYGINLILSLLAPFICI